MKQCFLKKTDKKSLDLVFLGYGQDEKPFQYLKDITSNSVALVYDYTDRAFDPSLYDEFEDIKLITWSMGVMISTLFDFENVKKYIAINGTPKAIDDKYGIPEKIYKLTVRGFNEASCKKFMERMFNTTPPLESFSSRTFSSQKEELENLMGIEGKYVSFDKIIVSTDDKIIPTKNQLNYWKNPAIIEMVEEGHCPFFRYKKWSEIL